ncbi:Membrane protein of ER body-like protein [Bienertia sinuspersici]
MEVPYKREVEDEELIGVDLKSRRKSKSQHQNKSNYSSFSSSESSDITSESSADSSSFEEYSVSMNNNSTIKGNSNNHNFITTTNGENPKIIEGRSENEEAVEALSQADEEAEFQETKIRDDYINVAQNQDNNGFTLHQDGVNVVGKPVPERNAGDRETDIGSNPSKSTETGVGLKDVEGLLDESSNNINVTLTETYNIENIVNKTFIVKGQNEIVETGPSGEIEPELEYDVEKVVRNQNTHDFYCPNCSSCITDRVILKRRKRKLKDISPDERPKPDQTVLDEQYKEEKGSKKEQNEDAKDPGARFGAISCLSCFSIFIPKGDGFLWWRFKPKPDVPPHSDGSTPLEYNDPGKLPLDDGTALQPGPKAPPISQDATDVQPSENKAPSPSYGDQSQPTPKPPGTDNSGPKGVTKEREPSSGLSDTSVQSTQPPIKLDTDGVKPHESKPTPQSEDNTVPNMPLFSTPDPGEPSPSAQKPPVTSEKGHVTVTIHVGQTCPEPLATQPIQPGTLPAPAIYEPLLHGHPRPGVSGLDIIKAIVYGGLVECITSLSVISSAAGGDATTYQLGRRDHFLLHAVVAILSYITFGLLSPVIYGFSFRKSDNKNYKLATLAAASLVCITVLSIGKAYVRRPRKYIKTIFYYISMGFMVSGVGYVAGDLINMLLKKLGVFDANAPVAMPGLDTGVVKGAWSSY